MNRRRATRVYQATFAALAVLLVTVTGSAQVPATILTTIGETATGTLLGLSPTSRLVASIPPHIGPANVFDIPIDAIQQITLDFPRVIVETAERVFIGPWSAFTGIPEALTLERGFEQISLVTSGLRAIALNNNALHEVPREWLGDGFLAEPKVLRRGGDLVASSDRSTTPVSTSDSSTELTLGPEPTVEDLFPTYPVESEPQAELPWWVPVVAVAAVAVIALLSAGGTASS